MSVKKKTPDCKGKDVETPCTESHFRSAKACIAIIFCVFFWTVWIRFSPNIRRVVVSKVCVVSRTMWSWFGQVVVL